MIFFRFYLISVICLLVSSLITKNDDINYYILEDILNNGIDNHVYPGVVAIVGDVFNNNTYKFALGKYTYNIDDPSMNIDTIFDIASLTKVVSTTSAIALLYQSGILDLNTYVGSILGESYNNGGKAQITILHCLLHNAGYAPDPQPWYWDKSFSCPNTNDTFPAEDFSCLDPYIYTSFLTEQVQSIPGTNYVYSDLSFITLQMVVGTLVLEHQLIDTYSMMQCMHSNHSSGISQPSKSEPHEYPEEVFLMAEKYSPLQIICAFEAYVRTHIFHRNVHGSSESVATQPQQVQLQEIKGNSLDVITSWLPNTTYLPARNTWPHCAPTLNDTNGENVYTNKRLQGQVSDGDCYAMGGIAGHAGVFSTITDMGVFAEYMLLHSSMQHNNLHVIYIEDKIDDFLNATTIKLFTTIYNESQSSRALGWSTNSFLAEDYGYDHSCGSMSKHTFMHTGYTGTCICIDPENLIYTVILTNRAYNCQGQLCPTGSSDAVKLIYKEFNTAVINMLPYRN